MVGTQSACTGSGSAAAIEAATQVARQVTNQRDVLLESTGPSREAHTAVATATL